MDVEKTIEFILEQQAYTASLLAKSRETGERTDRRLDRAVKLAVREARAERKRRQELDAKVAAAQAALDEELKRLAAAQRVTEEKWQSFMDFMRHGNGSH